MQKINEKLTKFTLKYINGKENVQLMHIKVKQNMSQKWIKIQEKIYFNVLNMYIMSYTISWTFWKC